VENAHCRRLLQGPGGGPPDAGGRSCQPHLSLLEARALMTALLHCRCWGLPRRLTA
jgi:hypothetical protein